MYSDGDLHTGGVSPFGYPRINDRSHLPAAFRSVPRPSSPLGAKASTERPSLSPPTQSQARTQDQTAPHMHKTQEPGQRNTHTLTQSTNQPFHLHLSKEQSTRPAPRGPPGGGFGSTQLCPTPKGSQERISQPVARPTRADMEATGFEPVTPCLQSRCSTS